MFKLTLFIVGWFTHVNKPSNPIVKLLNNYELINYAFYNYWSFGRVRKFGGTVSEKINKKVTHVIFHGGTKSNYLKVGDIGNKLIMVFSMEELNWII